MKKLMLILVSIVGMATSANAQSQEAKKIARTVESQYGKCTTEDGKAGYYQPVGKREVTTQSNTNSNTRNSGSVSVGGSFEAGTKGVSGSMNAQRNSGTTSGTNSTTGTTTTETQYKCFEQKNYQNK